MPSSVKVNRLSKRMLMKKKSDSTTSTMDTSLSSVDVMSEHHPEPSTSTLGGSSSNLMLSNSDRMGSLSKREFEKCLRKEMKEIKKARVKSFKQKKALLGMPDIDEISDNARKAEKLRQKRRSTTGTSSRGSLSGSRSSLTGTGSLMSDISQQENEPDIDHSRRSESVHSHGEHPVPKDAVGKEEQPTTPTTVCSVLRGDIPIILEFSPIPLPDLGPLDDCDDHQGGEAARDGAMEEHQQQEEELGANHNHEDSLAFSNHTTNLHLHNESSQLFPHLTMDHSHTELQDNQQGTDLVGDLLYPTRRRSSMSEEEEEQVPGDQKGQDDAEAGAPGVAIEDLDLPLPSMDQVPSRQQLPQEEAAGEGNEDEVTAKEEVSVESTRAKVSTSPTLAPTTQAPIVVSVEPMLPLPEPQQSESDPTATADATTTAEASLDSAPDTIAICPDHPVQKQRRVSNLVQLRHEWIEEYNELQKEPQGPSMTQGEFILMKGEQRKQMLLQRQRELLLEQQQEAEEAKQKGKVIALASTPQFASENDGSSTNETVASTPSPSPPPPPTPSSLLDEDISQLEQETWLFREQIRKLELQLQETQQAEREELWMIKEMSSTTARNEAIAEQVRDEYQSEQQQEYHNDEVDTDEDKDDDYFLQLQQQRKDQEALVNELQIENKARRAESQALNLQMVSLMQSNQRLEKATQETQDFNRELQLTLIQETADHHKTLLTELQMYQRQQISLERQIPKAVAYAQNERRLRRLYTKGNDTIVRHVLEEAFDRRLIEAITEMPPLVVTKSRKPRGNKSVTSLGVVW